MRHGNAVATTKTGKDADRPLSEKGVLEVEKIGEILDRQNFHPATVLCSPALRTRQTFCALHLGFKYKS
ncbi:histidine phosphatase family protein [uncultured Bartonella sp.]|uniref:SixA phosphatase family protein n=1 Tax=uncultured Bartonella sp. TaxID=104108 RepID=UPI0025F67417|nr:histidine phosphatase family protein [uncultured Bartonella sp.]